MKQNKIQPSTFSTDQPYQISLKSV